MTHTIGDALYDLETFEDPRGLMDERTVMYAIVKRTKCFVYINPTSLWKRDRGELIRFPVADLERNGHAYNHANLQMVYTRPLLHWPLLVVDNRPANVLQPDWPVQDLDQHPFDD